LPVSLDCLVPFAGDLGVVRLQCLDLLLVLGVVLLFNRLDLLFDLVVQLVGITQFLDLGKSRLRFRWINPLERRKLLGSLFGLRNQFSNRLLESGHVLKGERLAPNHG